MSPSDSHKQKYLEYLATCKGGKEIYSFDYQKDADIFGNNLRDIIAKEEGTCRWELDDLVNIQIGYLTVRIELRISVKEYNESLNVQI